MQITSLVSCRSSLRKFWTVRSGSSSSTRAMEYCTSPVLLMAWTGRMAELCSMEDRTTWPPPAIAPLMAIFNAMVQFKVKITFSGWAPNIAAAFSRTLKTLAAARMEILWPLRPGLPP